ncbi:7133_t:CDS:2 [Entrophospora sp. SA101]|nr:7133_t:CDS:2 [Entrophospora sp. SA101]CAJ0907969.1 6976_t:CDS:2 [Entrophospora sp. SA101]
MSTEILLAVPSRHIGKRNVGSELYVLCTPVEYQNRQKLAHAKLNCDQQNYTRTNVSVTKKVIFDSLESEMVNSVSTGQEANKGPDPQPKGARTPPPRSSNEERLLSTPNKQNMHNEEIVCDAPPVWTKSLESYLNNAFKKGDEFKIAIMKKLNGDEGNYFRLYCEKVLIDFYNLIDIFPDMSRKIGEQKYIIQNRFYETMFGKICFDWIESHSPAGKLTKSATNSGIIKVGMREVFHMEVSGPPSLPSK